ncbi:DNA methyltransferase [Chryseobacterium arthrosphaerae]|uniref:DNA methyltransferase n=1 Tax=Chryseobacterium arthrosphaerae TaxID=651561 RepID=UPI001E3888CF|nr:DNA methyltransferase [Chryseobacterium arthrosphaerae]
MDKELINIETIISNKSGYFLEYLKDISNNEIIRFIEDLSQFSEIYIFSGVIRNFFIDFKEKARDIDIVYQGDDNKLNHFLSHYDYRRNSFNGYKINLAGFTIDLWRVDSTWAIINEKHKEAGEVGEFFNEYILPSSTFFNFSSIIFNYKTKKFLYTKDFLDFLETKILDLVLEKNPLPELCIVNTIYYKEKFKLKISERLKRFCINNFKNYTAEQFDYIQQKHFNEIKYSYEDLKEYIEVFKMTSNLLEELNLFDKDELFYYSDLFKPKKSEFLNSRLKASLIKLAPIAFFCIKNEPLILFFDNYKNLNEFEEKEIQIWNFNQSPVIFINDRNKWVIKNGFKLLNSRFGLEEIPNSKIKDFDYFEIITGKTWDKYQKEFSIENRVDYFLLNNISEFRQKLISPDFNLHPKIANFLIGRAIFVRYLIDRKINLDKYYISNKDDFHRMILEKESCYLFFKEILADFSDNLFPLQYNIDGIIINEYDHINNSHLSLLVELLQGGILSKSGGTILSLFDLYDFSIIPIEFISSIYERFIGVENQASRGAYYTPLFLVDYIQKETVNNYFKIHFEEYNCKVLDPACGSGIFLVETLRLIISQYKKLNPNYKDNDEQYHKYKTALKNIVLNNIFGIDKDENAIHVAIFSIYITLLDNLSSKSVQDFKLPDLLHTNLFIADFFDLNADFNSKLKNLKFQFILGNPPWKTKHPKEKQLFEKYIEQRKFNEKSFLEIENREISEAFLVRVSDFNFVETALIVVSKILYKVSRRNNKGGFRKYFLNNFLLRKVVELSSVRHQIFNQSGDSAIAPATILFYNKIDNFLTIENNIVCHISLKPNIFFELFKLMVIEKYDIKNIFQKKFIEDDWLWKVLVYGNILDYIFIKRFKEIKSIYEYINDKESFLFGKGISVGGGDKNDITAHKEIEYSINSKQKGLKPFHIDYSENFLKELQFVHRPRKISLFKAPVLLVGKGITNDFKAKASISSIDVIYTDAITGIKPISKHGEKVIYTLESLFNSKLFSYFLIETNSSIGIEREQSHDKDDKFSVPLIVDEDEVLKGYSDKIKMLYASQSNNEFYDYDNQLIDIYINENKKIIDNYILELYNISEQEKSLVNYANDIIIPLLKGNLENKKKIINKINFKEFYLEKYVSVFIEHFSKRFNSKGNKFQVEISWSEFIILIKFKIVPSQNTEKKIILWEKIENNQLLYNLSKLGFEKLNDNLFLQKDIKGFEEEYFYVAKPNQHKSWHSALAYLDLAEFIDEFFNMNTKYNEN